MCWKFDILKYDKFQLTWLFWFVSNNLWIVDQTKFQDSESQHTTTNANDYIS